MDVDGWEVGMPSEGFRTTPYRAAAELAPGLALQGGETMPNGDWWARLLKANAGKKTQAGDKLPGRQR